MKLNARVAPTEAIPEAEPASPRRRQQDRSQLTDAAGPSGGVLAAARRQGRAEQLEKPSWPRVQIARSKVDLITGDTGKWADSERVTDGLVVAKKAGNSAGAKEPCWL